jgi:hypothetical protein
MTILKGLVGLIASWFPNMRLKKKEYPCNCIT